MSRLPIILSFSLTSLAIAAPAQAQAQITAEEALANARQVYRITEPPREPCPEPREGEIVVCRDIVDPETQRMPSPTERAEASGVRPPDPIPRAPDMVRPCNRKQGDICNAGPEPYRPIIIDLDAIPEAPDFEVGRAEKAGGD